MRGEIAVFLIEHLHAALVFIQLGGIVGLGEQIFKQDGIAGCRWDASSSWRESLRDSLKTVFPSISMLPTLTLGPSSILKVISSDEGGTRWICGSTLAY